LISLEPGLLGTLSEGSTLGMILLVVGLMTGGSAVTTSKRGLMLMNAAPKAAWSATSEAKSD